MFVFSIKNLKYPYLAVVNGKQNKTHTRGWYAIHACCCDIKHMQFSHFTTQVKFHLHTNQFKIALLETEVFEKQKKQI